MFNLFRKKPDDAAMRTLYAAIVGVARTPELFSDIAIPDTVDGRYEALALVTGLVVDRLTLAGGGAKAKSPETEAARQLSAIFFEAMDAALREIGIGYQRIPKHMTSLAEGFYGRTTAYTTALKAEDLAALQQALERNILPDQATAPVDFARLSIGVADLYRQINAAEIAALLAGSLAISWQLPPNAG